MAKIMVNGIQMEIPDSITTTETLLQMGQSDASDVSYQLDTYGNQKVLAPGQEVEVKDGDRFGTVSRFRTGDSGLKDLRRLQAECQLLERNYGANRVFWPANYDWILINGFKLPPNLNRQSSSVLVLVPDHYGYGQAYRDLFVSTGLRPRCGNEWRELPHYFEKFPYDSLTPEFVNELRDKKWSYLCLHPDSWKATDNILTFLVQVYTFLNNPFYDWDNYGGYENSYHGDDEEDNGDDEDEDDQDDEDEDEDDEDDEDYEEENEYEDGEYGYGYDY